MQNDGMFKRQFGECSTKKDKHLDIEWSNAQTVNDQNVPMSEKKWTKWDAMERSTWSGQMPEWSIVRKYKYWKLLTTWGDAFGFCPLGIW
mgnify:CR=1 FL=1